MDFLAESKNSFDDDFVQVSRVETTDLRSEPDDPLINELSKINLEGSPDLASLHELIAQACQAIKKEKPASFLRSLEISMTNIQQNLNLWKVANELDLEMESSWNNFLSTYMKIPEKFVSVFDQSEMPVSVPFKFYQKIFKDADEISTVNSLHARLVNRLMISGFQDDFFAQIVEISEGSLCPRILEQLGMLKKIDFIVGTLKAADYRYESNEAFVCWLMSNVLTALSTSPEIRDSLLDEIIKYEIVSKRAVVLLLSCLYWTEEDIPSNEYLQKQLGLRSKSPLFGSIILTHLSFISSHDANFPQIAPLITNAISKRLDNGDPAIRLQAMIWAETFARISGSTTALYFELDENDEAVLEYRNISHLIREVDRIINSGQQFVPYKFEKPLLEAKSLQSPPEDYYQVKLEPSHQIQLSLKDLELKKSLPQIQIKEARNSKIKRPRFLRDCLEYLRSDDPEKWEYALEDLPSILSNSFILELKEFGGQLFNSLLFLSDQFNLDGFEVKRMDLLGLIIQKLPENCLRMLKSEFVGRSMNIGQKSDILSLIMVQLKANITGNLEPAGPTTSDSLTEIFALIDLSETRKIFEGNNCGCNMAVLIDHFYLPLLNELNDVRSKTFQHSHEILLEKTILCFSLFFYASSNDHILRIKFNVPFFK